MRDTIKSNVEQIFNLSDTEWRTQRDGIELVIKQLIGIIESLETPTVATESERSELRSVIVEGARIVISDRQWYVEFNCPYCTGESQYGALRVPGYGRYDFFCPNGGCRGVFTISLENSPTVVWYERKESEESR